MSKMNFDINMKKYKNLINELKLLNEKNNKFNTIETITFESYSKKEIKVFQESLTFISTFIKKIKKIRKKSLDKLYKLFKKKNFKHILEFITFFTFSFENKVFLNIKNNFLSKNNNLGFQMFELIKINLNIFFGNKNNEFINLIFFFFWRILNILMKVPCMNCYLADNINFEYIRGFLSYLNKKEIFDFLDNCIKKLDFYKDDYIYYKNKYINIKNIFFIRYYYSIKLDNKENYLCELSQNFIKLILLYEDSCSKMFLDLIFNYIIDRKIVYLLKYNVVYNILKNNKNNMCKLSIYNEKIYSLFTIIKLYPNNDNIKIIIEFNNYFLQLINYGKLNYYKLFLKKIIKNKYLTNKHNYIFDKFFLIFNEFFIKNKIFNENIDFKLINYFFENINWFNNILNNAFEKLFNWMNLNLKNKNNNNIFTIILLIKSIKRVNYNFLIEEKFFLKMTKKIYWINLKFNKIKVNKVINDIIFDNNIIKFKNKNIMLKYLRIIIVFINLNNHTNKLFNNLKFYFKLFCYQRIEKPIFILFLKKIILELKLIDDINYLKSDYLKIIKFITTSLFDKYKLFKDIMFIIKLVKIIKILMNNKLIFEKIEKSDFYDFFILKYYETFYIDILDYNEKIINLLFFISFDVLKLKKFKYMKYFIDTNLLDYCIKSYKFLYKIFYYCFFKLNENLKFLIYKNMAHFIEKNKNYIFLELFLKLLILEAKYNFKNENLMDILFIYFKISFKTNKLIIFYQIKNIICNLLDKSSNFKLFLNFMEKELLPIYSKYNCFNSALKIFSLNNFSYKINFLNVDNFVTKYLNNKNKCLYKLNSKTIVINFNLKNDLKFEFKFYIIKLKYELEKKIIKTGIILHKSYLYFYLKHNRNYNFIKFNTIKEKIIEINKLNNYNEFAFNLNIEKNLVEIYLNGKIIKEYTLKSKLNDYYTKIKTIFNIGFSKKMYKNLSNHILIKKIIVSELLKEEEINFINILKNKSIYNFLLNDHFKLNFKKINKDNFKILKNFFDLDNIDNNNKKILGLELIKTDIFNKVNQFYLFDKKNLIKQDNNFIINCVNKKYKILIRLDKNFNLKKKKKKNIIKKIVNPLNYIFSYAFFKKFTILSINIISINFFENFIDTYLLFLKIKPKYILKEKINNAFIKILENKIFFLSKNIIKKVINLFFIIIDNHLIIFNIKFLNKFINMLIKLENKYLIFVLEEVFYKLNNFEEECIKKYFNIIDFDLLNQLLIYLVKSFYLIVQKNISKKDIMNFIKNMILFIYPKYSAHYNHYHEIIKIWNNYFLYFTNNFKILNELKNIEKNQSNNESITLIFEECLDNKLKISLENNFWNTNIILNFYNLNELEMMFDDLIFEILISKEIYFNNINLKNYIYEEYFESNYNIILSKNKIFNKKLIFSKTNLFVRYFYLKKNHIINNKNWILILKKNKFFSFIIFYILMIIYDLFLNKKIKDLFIKYHFPQKILKFYNHIFFKDKEFDINQSGLIDFCFNLLYNNLIYNTDKINPKFEFILLNIKNFIFLINKITDNYFFFIPKNKKIFKMIINYYLKMENFHKNNNLLFLNSNEIRYFLNYLLKKIIFIIINYMNYFDDVLNDLYKFFNEINKDSKNKFIEIFFSYKYDNKIYNLENKFNFRIVIIKFINSDFVLNYKYIIEILKMLNLELININSYNEVKELWIQILKLLIINSMYLVDYKKYLEIYEYLSIMNTYFFKKFEINEKFNSIILFNYSNIIEEFILDQSLTIKEKMPQLINFEWLLSLYLDNKEDIFITFNLKEKISQIIKLENLINFKVDKIKKELKIYINKTFNIKEWKWKNWKKKEIISFKNNQFIKNFIDINKDNFQIISYDSIENIFINKEIDTEKISNKIYNKIFNLFYNFILKEYKKIKVNHLDNKKYLKFNYKIKILLGLRNNRNLKKGYNLVKKIENRVNLKCFKKKLITEVLENNTNFFIKENKYLVMLENSKQSNIKPKRIKSSNLLDLKNNNNSPQLDKNKENKSISIKKIFSNERNILRKKKNSTFFNNLDLNWKNKSSSSIILNSSDVNLKSYQNSVKINLNNSENNINLDQLFKKFLKYEFNFEVKCNLRKYFNSGIIKDDYDIIPCIVLIYECYFMICLNYEFKNKIINLKNYGKDGINYLKWFINEKNIEPKYFKTNLIYKKNKLYVYKIYFIKEIILKNIFNSPIGVEINLNYCKHLFLVFNINEVNSFLKTINENIINLKNVVQIEPSTYDLYSKNFFNNEVFWCSYYKQNITKIIIELWNKKKISNFEFLNFINYFMDRSLVNIYNYYIFPVLLKDFKIKDNKYEIIKRDLEKPMGLNNENIDLDELKKLYKFKKKNLNANKSNFWGCFYSHKNILEHYLFRIFPYTNYHYRSNKKFDSENRNFNCIVKSFKINSEESFLECIPEIYTFPEIFTNINNLKHENVFKDIHLNSQVKNINSISYCLKSILESDYTNKKLNNWCDLIFGINQRGNNAYLNYNLFDEIVYDVNYKELISEKKFDLLNFNLKKNLFFGSVPNNINYKFPEKIQITNNQNKSIEFKDTIYRIDLLKENIFFRIKNNLLYTKTNYWFNFDEFNKEWKKVYLRKKNILVYNNFILNYAMENNLFLINSKKLFHIYHDFGEIKEILYNNERKFIIMINNKNKIIMAKIFQCKENKNLNKNKSKLKFIREYFLNYYNLKLNVEKEKLIDDILNIVNVDYIKYIKYTKHFSVSINLRNFKVIIDDFHVKINFIRISNLSNMLIIGLDQNIYLFDIDKCNFMHKFDLFHFYNYDLYNNFFNKNNNYKEYSNYYNMNLYTKILTKIQKIKFINLSKFNENILIVSNNYFSIYSNNGFFKSIFYSKKSIKKGLIIDFGLNIKEIILIIYKNKVILYNWIHDDIEKMKKKTKNNYKINFYNHIFYLKLEKEISIKKFFQINLKNNINKIMNTDISNFKKQINIYYVDKNNISRKLNINLQNKINNS